MMNLGLDLYVVGIGLLTGFISAVLVLVFPVAWKTLGPTMTPVQRFCSFVLYPIFISGAMIAQIIMLPNDHLFTWGVVSLIFFLYCLWDLSKVLKPVKEKLKERGGKT